MKSTPVTYFFGALMMALFVVSCARGRGSFVLINKADEPIVAGVVEICRQKIELRDIQSGKKVVGFFDVRGEDHFTIDIQFQSGKTIRKETGYVTSGFDEHYEIVVSGGAVEITDAFIRSRYGSDDFARSSADKLIVAEPDRAH
jgi:hypothetical protein